MNVYDVLLDNFGYRKWRVGYKQNVSRVLQNKQYRMLSDMRLEIRCSKYY